MSKLRDGGTEQFLRRNDYYGYWGAAIRKVFDHAELIAMLMENELRHPVKGISIKDSDDNTLRDYLLNRFCRDFERQHLSVTE